jgi:hypothetical protein
MAELNVPARDARHSATGRPDAVTGRPEDEHQARHFAATNYSRRVHADYAR